MIKSINTKIIIFTAVFVVFLLSIFYFLLSNVFAATNISATSSEHYAWNDLIGWIDFYSTGNVNVTSTQLTGYASSSVGYIALDCATSPNGNICGTSNFKVFNNGSGNLTGWAYNDNIGWISFDGGTATSTYPYQVIVNSTTGDFSGWAWNDDIGWINFNCDNPGAGGCTYPYKVKTNWIATSTTANLTSSVFDTSVLTGVALNTIMWQGSQPSGTSVKFQVASSNSISSTVSATGTIDSVYRYAWNDSVGWIDFGYSAGNVNVNDAQLTGYAYSTNIFEIALDCATSPVGNICLTSNFKVNRDSATGDLTGWAWNDNIGWISFCGNASSGSTWDGSKWVCPASPTYQVKTSTSTGAFTGWAWNDDIGWISFNCSDPGICGSSDYRVNTVVTVLSNWIYRGPDGSNTTYYAPVSQNASVKINPAYHNNHRYFRYKIFLYSNSSRTQSPTVDNVIINWSP